VNDHVQLLEGLVTAALIIDNAQAFAYAQIHLASKAGRNKDMLNYGVVFAALVMARLQLEDAHHPAIDIAERRMNTL
jgi:hypothetical protein